MRTPVLKLGDADTRLFLASLKEARKHATLGMCGTPAHSDEYVLLTRLTAAMDRVAELMTGDMDCLKNPQVTVSATVAKQR